MIIGIVKFSAIKPGKEAAFLEWFSLSNAMFEQQPGFISRKLIKPINNENTYMAIIEFEDLANFKEVAKHPFHAESAQRLAAIVEEMPVPELYNEVNV